jgi:flagellar hook-basal body complex protein FliE
VHWDRSAPHKTSHPDCNAKCKWKTPKSALEETMVAIQKAQIGFQATLHVRNRMVQAYTDIMNMQV